jgi:hypothetical protein
VQEIWVLEAMRKLTVSRIFLIEFRSLASTVYISTLILTGQGGPDPTNLPWYTKAVVLLTGVLYIGMFALPASMLTWGFVAQAERCAKMAYNRPKGNTSSQVDKDDWSDSADSYSTDEEYLKIIAGCDDRSCAGSEQTRSKFPVTDTDGSGNIQLTEISVLPRDNFGTALYEKNEDLAARVSSLDKTVQDQCDKLDTMSALLEALQSGLR